MNRSTIARPLARKIRLFVLATLLGTLANVAAPPPVAHALTLKVDTTADDPSLNGCTYFDLSDCSLRGAIEKANNNAGLDTITFSASLDGTPITLTIIPDGTPNDNLDGDLDILGGGGDLIIRGNGAANTIIDGGGIDRVFHVCPGGGCANTVTFEGVTIQRGDAGAVEGGGIFNAGGTTTVDGSAVISNTAKFGGGLYNTGNTMAVENSTISNNGSTATYGGGIYNDSGTTTVNRSTLSRNTAYDAGGIYNKDILTVTNSTIGGIGAGNHVTDYAGGIYNDGGTTMVDGCTISGNTADDGGGIYNYSGTTTVNDTAIISNTATWGGGIYNDGTLHVQNGSIIGKAGFGNQATDQGGGIYHYDGATTVDGSAISDNKAGYGGGIYLRSYGAVTVTVSRITNNTATTNGGGVFNDVDVVGAANVTGSCIVGNSATAFFNDKTAQQTATGNWWGAASGPSGVGPGEGDSVSANVVYSGFLTTSPPLCNYYVYLPLVVKE